MNTLIVHKGTGTIIDADDAYIAHGDFTDMDDEQVIDKVTSEGNYPVTKCWAVMHGNPFEGFSFEGPFWDYEDAAVWGDMYPTWEWYVVSINRSNTAE